MVGAINEALTGNGIRSLDDEAATVNRDGREIQVIGINRFAAFRSKITPTLEPDRPNIVLSHSPDVVDVLDDSPIDLALTGHTHGGQVNLPIVTKSVLPLRHKELVAGMYIFGRLRLYVNRGIGCLTLPLRLNARPEITLFRLKRSADA